MYVGRHISVIIAAAGSGSRMRSQIPKQLLEINGKPMLVKTTEAFEQNASVDDIIIVADKENLNNYREAFSKYTADARRSFSKLRVFVIGGKTRQESVRLGLDGLLEHADIVLIHDGARPFVSDQCIENVIKTVCEKGAATAVVPIIDTVKVAEGGKLKSTVDRDILYSVQTPQGFLADIIKTAHRKACEEGYEATDDTILAERIGQDIFPAEGDYRNIKITVPEDLLKEQNAGIEDINVDNTEDISVYNMEETIISKTRAMNSTDGLRVGIGFDAHRFSTERMLVIAGVEIDWEAGLLGHSDADAAVHALIDAMLGAAALGDIGRLFPDTDQRYKDISSLILLQLTVKKIREQGFILMNADITVIAEKPKLAPYINKMRKSLAKSMNVDISAVSIKATTTEGMGFCGREEGIAAIAVVQLLRGC